MKNAKWRSRNGRIALNIAGNGIVALIVIQLISVLPYSFGLQILNFIVLMIAVAILVRLVVDHFFPAIEPTPSLEQNPVGATPIAPMNVEDMPPLPEQKPSIGINQVKDLKEYRERRHRKRMFKEAWGAVLGLECLLLALVTSISFQALGSRTVVVILESGWVPSATFIAIWACYGWLAFESRVRKKIVPSDGKHPPHRFSHILSGGSYLVSVVWVTWTYLSINGATNDGDVMPIIIAGAACTMTAANCLTLYREYWWYQRHWLVVSGYRVYMTYPKNKWLWFKGGEPEINVWQVLNCIPLEQTMFEQWLFKDSCGALINGPGDDDKIHFGNMTDVLHFSELKEAVENNREVYNKRHQLFNQFDD